MIVLPIMYFEDNLWHYHFLLSITPTLRMGVITDSTYIYKCWPGSTLQSYNERHLISTIKKEIMAYQYAKTCPSWLKDYAASGFQIQKKAVLLASFKVEGVTFFCKEFARMRSHRVVSRRYYLQHVAKSKAEKMFAFFDFMPFPISCLLTYGFMLALQHKLNNTYHNLEVKKLKLDSNFWSNYLQVIHA